MSKSILVSGVCAISLLAFSSPTSAQQYQLLPIGDQQQLEAEWLALPVVPPPGPPGQLPSPLPTDVPGELVDYFRWDQVPEKDPWGVDIDVNYTVTQPYMQTLGTCYLFATLTAMEIETTISSAGWYSWGSETERGVRLSSMNAWSCNH